MERPIRTDSSPDHANSNGLVAALAIGVGAIAAAVMAIGWGLDVVLARRIHASFAAMVPSTAFCFLVASACVLLRLRPVAGWPIRALTKTAAVSIALVAGTNLMAIAATEANGIDTLIWPAMPALRTASMAVATATSFLLIATCLFRLDGPRGKDDLVFVGAATLGLVLAGIALTGYAFDAEALYEVSLFTAMALHTAICFGALFVALLVLRSDVGWMRVLLGEGGGSAGARRLLPGAVVVPFVLCLIALWATDVGVVNANFRLSVLAIAMIGLLTAVLLRYAVVQNAIERDLRDAVADRELLLREVYHRVKNNLQMTTALLRLGTREIEDEKALGLIDGTIARVESLGIVHRMLISARVPSRVQTEEFLRELCDNILAGQESGSTRVTIEVSARGAPLHVETAVTVGLLVNELVTNALKHAFVGRSEGRIAVEFARTADGGGELAVSDDGQGYDPEAAGRRRGVGSQLVKGLVAQLDAEMSTTSGPGHAVKIAIPRETFEGRAYE